MNRTQFYSIALVAAICAMLLGGCCWGVYCDCAVAGVFIDYRDANGNVNDLVAAGLEVETYEQSSNTLIVSASGIQAWEPNTVYIWPEPGQYWVIRVDSFGISDTVRLRSLSLSDKKRGCCDCGPRIEAIELEVNGVPFSQDNITRSY